MPDIILASIMLGGLVLPGRENAMKGGGPTPASDGRWLFPCAAWNGYKPTVSDTYSAVETAKHREHHGVDVMFARKAGGIDSRFAAGTPNASRGYFMPGLVYARAARDGVVWQVAKTGHGLAIVLDHGKPFATFYQHLSSVLFPIGAKGNRVVAGQPLGIIGYSPLDAQKLMHLHFEIWFNGGASSHVDPWPILATAPLPEDTKP